MKIKKLILLFFLIILSFSCKKKNTKEFNYNTAFEYKVEESDILFILPKGYSKKTFSEYKKLISESELSEEIKNDQYKIIEKISQKFQNVDLFVEMNSLQNLIWILRQTPHVELDKNALKFITKTFKQVERNNDLGVQKEEFISSKLYFKELYKYVQIRTKQNTVNRERYVTHYYISTRKKSFGISFVNIEDLNFLNYVNRIKILK